MKRKPRATRATRENPEWTAATFERAQPARDALPGLVGSVAATRLLTPRGRPKSSNARLAISLRLPPDTLARWKATGPGWQTRMAEVLSRAVGRRST
ncbi:MAG TPA: BrnA antitoxin family protein [Burkholderiales bacterium]|nr:BrnA antitoxin family protein [Burkholderiales bacterium]